jgi:hypothetical protein
MFVGPVYGPDATGNWHFNIVQGGVMTALQYGTKRETMQRREQVCAADNAHKVPTQELMQAIFTAQALATMSVPPGVLMTAQQAPVELEDAPVEMPEEELV